MISIDGQEYNIGDDDFPVIGEELTFGQAVGSEGDGGGYQGEVVVGVTAPEPATILGLLAVGGLGLGLKRKK